MREPFSGFGAVTGLSICHGEWNIAIVFPRQSANFDWQKFFCDAR
jgi:hypothetical protein